MDRAMWLCGSPLCGSMIYEHQKKYGSGTYCNKDCALEASMYEVRVKEVKEVKEKKESSKINELFDNYYGKNYEYKKTK